MNLRKHGYGWVGLHAHVGSQVMTSPWQQQQRRQQQQQQQQQCDGSPAAGLQQRFTDVTTYRYHHRGGNPFVQAGPQAAVEAYH